MKRFILFISCVMFSSFAFGQTEVTTELPKEYKNVIGIDASGLLRQFFNFNSSGPSYFTYPYMISYRRVFKSNAIRVGIGGNITTYDGTTNDTLHGISRRTDFNTGIGFEHYSNLSKRWNFYFGGDVIMNSRNYDDVSPRTATTSYRYVSISRGFGLAPLLGIQFKINSRISLATETSYGITYVTRTSSRAETPASVYDTYTKSTGLETYFGAPVAINFRIAF